MMNYQKVMKVAGVSVALLTGAGAIASANPFQTQDPWNNPVERSIRYLNNLDTIREIISANKITAVAFKKTWSNVGDQIVFDNVQTSLERTGIPFVTVSLDQIDVLRFFDKDDLDYAESAGQMFSVALIDNSGYTITRFVPTRKTTIRDLERVLALVTDQRDSIISTSEEAREFLLDPSYKAILVVNSVTMDSDVMIAALETVSSNAFIDGFPVGLKMVFTNTAAERFAFGKIKPGSGFCKDPYTVGTLVLTTPDGFIFTQKDLTSDMSFGEMAAAIDNAVYHLQRTFRGRVGSPGIGGPGIGAKSHKPVALPPGPGSGNADVTIPKP